eukprot:4153371-Pyramimonas_sp.AAC.1
MFDTREAVKATPPNIDSLRSIESQFRSPASGDTYWGVECTLAVIGTGGPRHPNSDWRLSMLDPAVLDFCPPGSGGPKPLDRAKKNAICYLLFGGATFPNSVIYD